MKAAGEDVIGFGAGEPDFPTPAHIVEAAGVAAQDPAAHHYSATPGLPALRQAIADKTLRDSGYEVGPGQVVVTNGGKQAYYEAIESIINPGDEVLLPAPYWTTYPEPIALAGGTSVVLPTDEAAGFRVTVDQLEAARTERTKALRLRVARPTRPAPSTRGPRSRPSAAGPSSTASGSSPTRSTSTSPTTTTSSPRCPSSCPRPPTRRIVLNGVAKTYAMTGWRVGWIIGPPDLVEAASTLQSHLCGNVANVSQRATIAALEGGLDDVAMMRAEYDRRGKLIHRLLNEIDGVSCMLPQGAFYAFPSFEGVLGRELAGQTPTTTLGPGRPDPGRGQGRLRARRGVRVAGLRPVLLRPRPRGHAGRHPPHRRVPGVTARSGARSAP